MKYSGWLSLCLLCAIAFSSCSRKDHIPTGIIGIQKMSNILLDMQEADVYNDNYIDTAYSIEIRDQRLKIFYAQILMIHDVDKKEFLDSYAFYENRPDLMKKVYLLMQTNVDRKKAVEDSIANKNELRRTSVRVRNELIQKFENYKLPFQRYIDSFPILKPLRIFKPLPTNYDQVRDTALHPSGLRPD